MHNETSERVQKIRSRVLAGKAAVADLHAQITDDHVKQLLQQVLNHLDDVEVLWLGNLQHEQRPLRTIAEESRWLDQTEFFLERIALPQLEAVQEMVATFGPNVLLRG
jgi:uncharacterized damage-inducible protein DinB